MVYGNTKAWVKRVKNKAERAREKAALLAPSFSRQNVELISPTVERELGILARQGKLPDMPPELIEAEGEYEVVYDSPLARAQRSEETVGFARTMEMIIPIAQQDPSVLAMFDFEKTSRGLAELNGMPAARLCPPHNPQPPQVLSSSAA